MPLPISTNVTFIQLNWKATENSNESPMRFLFCQKLCLPKYVPLLPDSPPTTQVSLQSTQLPQDAVTVPGCCRDALCQVTKAGSSSGPLCHWLQKGKALQCINWWTAATTRMVFQSQRFIMLYCEKRTWIYPKLTQMWFSSKPLHVLLCPVPHSEEPGNQICVTDQYNHKCSHLAQKPNHYVSTTQTGKKKNPTIHIFCYLTRKWDIIHNQDRWGTSSATRIHHRQPD